MAADSPSGLLVLEKEVTHARSWRWFLALLLALLVAAGAFVLLRGLPLSGLPGLAQVESAGLALPLALAGLVGVAAVAIVALVAIGRLVSAGTLARQQRSLLDSIVASVPDAVVVADGRGRYKANAAAVQLFGLAAESGSWGDLHDAMARLDRRNAATGNRIPAGAGVLEGAMAGRPMSMDEVIVTPQGPRTLHVTGSTIHLKRPPHAGLILASDVTERLAIQRDLQAAKDGLQRKNAEYLQMARAIAHDLGNALTPAHMHVSILEMDKKGVARSLPVISRSLDQVHRLVGDLSDMARMESGAMKVYPRRVDLAPSIASAVAAFHPIAQEKGVALEQAPAPAAAVMADPERLGQVLSNLMTNAIKFTPQGGRVDVTAEPVGGHIRVAVKDSGLGLDRGQMERLFKPFSQVHDPTKVRERGTGLGLYICKGLVERQGGAIGVESEGPGLGSTFWFTVPLAKE
jgi:signal transduction histidine kinase